MPVSTSFRPIGPPAGALSLTGVAWLSWGRIPPAAPDVLRRSLSHGIRRVQEPREMWSFTMVANDAISGSPLRSGCAGAWLQAQWLKRYVASSAPDSSRVVLPARIQKTGSFF